MMRIVLNNKSAADRAHHAIQQALEHPSLMEMILQPYATPITTRQRGRYRAIVEFIAKHTGETHNRTHDILKFYLLPPRVITKGGKEIEKLGSTEDLSRDEYAIYCEEVFAFATTELGIIIPHNFTRSN